MSCGGLRVFLIVMILSVVPVAVAALEVESITVEHSDEMVYDGTEHFIEYSGDVRLSSEEMSLAAERIILVLDEAEKEVIRAEAYGDVRFTKADISARAGKILYDVSKGEVRLLERPEVSRPGQKLSADRITYWLDPRRVEARGNVRGFFVPSPGKKK